MIMSIFQISLIVQTCFCEIEGFLKLFKWGHSNIMRSTMWGGWGWGGFMGIEKDHFGSQGVLSKSSHNYGRGYCLEGIRTITSYCRKGLQTITSSCLKPLSNVRKCWRAIQ